MWAYIKNVVTNPAVISVAKQSAPWLGLLAVVGVSALYLRKVLRDERRVPLNTNLKSVLENYGIGHFIHIIDDKNGKVTLDGYPYKGADVHFYADGMNANEAGVNMLLKIHGLDTVEDLIMG